MSVKKPLLEDYSPYIFRTHDGGKTWTKIVSGIAPNDYLSSVREDPTRQGLLYAGAEHGFYVSFDDGDHWHRFSNGLPDTQISDIWVEADDVTIATHGRGFYVLDDVSALRQQGAAPTTTEATLFKPADAIHSAGTATIDYLLKEQPKSLKLEILDSRGTVIRSVDGAPPKEKPANAPPEDDDGPRRGPVTAAMTAGLNRFHWDLRYEPIVSFPGLVLWGATTNGPMALPGPYQVRLTVDGASQTEPLTIKKHPFRTVSQADLQAQFDLATQIRDKVNEANEAVIHIRTIKKEIADRMAKKNDSDLRAIANRLTRTLTEVEEDVYQVRNQSNQDPLNFPIKINNRLASLLRVVETGDGRPTGNVDPIFNDIKQELKVQTDKLQQALTTDLPTFNRLATRMGLEEVK